MGTTISSGYMRGTRHNINLKCALQPVFGEKKVNAYLIITVSEHTSCMREIMLLDRIVRDVQSFFFLS